MNRTTPNNLVLVVLDSLRYDSWVSAAPPNMAKLGRVERRWSYASWTVPSHQNLLTGLLPHESPERTLASLYYRRSFARFAERLNVGRPDFRDMLPQLWLPTLLKRNFGYHTGAFVSMPVLNPSTRLNHDFDDYTLMARHDDLKSILLSLDVTAEPFFYLLNVGETHYPYTTEESPAAGLPRVSGLHGALRDLDDDSAGQDFFFSEGQLRELRERQIASVSFVDRLMSAMFDVLPANTWVIVTADHGELFGEDGQFGHGPMVHPKVFEVPFVEGIVPR